MALNWISDEVSFTQAKALTTRFGGVIVNEDIADYTFAQEFPSQFNPYGPFWTGIERTSNGWVNGSGASIAKPEFAMSGGDPDPTANGPYAARNPFYGDPGYLLSADASDAYSFIFTYAGSGAGTEFNDGFVFGVGAVGVTTRLGAGNDFVGGSALGMIDAGSGNDVLLLDDQNEAPLTLIDGAGRDVISSVYGIIKPTLDGEDDFEFSTVHGRVSYENAKQGITGGAGSLYSAEIGHDELVWTPQLNLGSGDDNVYGYSILVGGAGNDTLTAYKRAEGGKGNDTLIADSFERVALSGGEGNDTLVLRTIAEATGGSGADKFVFEAVAKTTITDLGAGDKIDLSAILETDAAHAFSEGFLNVTQRGGYTYGLIDIDGGGDSYVDLFSVKGNFATTISDYLVF
ncbi:type I secretion C-terminal target domain-containing protein [Sphingobium sp. KCTC 72723]|uniref:type I secretion C-terminal target domain-containing protein n=1 Tax=Sphingobium sp. KCTC 72723 TaxID=2733867 RepID=UPI00165EBA75|nr:type I secretion C-terminal target domain-containing protein [Sphingobium sp. KCTC 72723]